MHGGGRVVITKKTRKFNHTCIQNAGNKAREDHFIWQICKMPIRTQISLAKVKQSVKFAPLNFYFPDVIIKLSELQKSSAISDIYIL